MKPYLQHLCDEIDYITTGLDEDWEAQLLSALYRHISAFENNAEGSIEDLLKDLQEGIVTGWSDEQKCRRCTES